MLSAPEAIGAQLSPEWHTWRSRCDISASDAHEAIGLGTDVSRSRWLSIRLGEEKRPEKSEYVMEMLARGKRDQPFAQDAYAEKLLDKEEVILPEWHYARAVHIAPDEVYIIGATPDCLVCNKDSRVLLRAVELKTLQHGEEGVYEQPKPANVLQAVIQLFCTGLEECHLFYFRRATEECKCFRIRSSEKEFLDTVWPWLQESLRATDPKKLRMPAGEKERREVKLLKTFVR